jgi:hypothetical protein
LAGEHLGNGITLLNSKVTGELREIMRLSQIA